MKCADVRWFSHTPEFLPHNRRDTRYNAAAAGGVAFTRVVDGGPCCGPSRRENAIMNHTLRQAVLAAACAAVLPVAFIAAPARGGVTLYDSASQAAPAPQMMDLQWLSGLSRPGAYVIRPNPLAARGTISS